MNFQCSAAERMLFAELVMRGASPPSVGLVVEGFNRHHWPMVLWGTTRGNRSRDGLHARSPLPSHFLTESSWLKVQAVKAAV